MILRSFCHAHFYQKGINQHLRHHAPSIGPNPEIPRRWVPLPPISSNDCAPQPSQWHPWKSKFSEYSMVDMNVRFHSKIDFQIRFAILFPVFLIKKTIPLINHFQSQSVEWTSNIFAHQKFGPDQHSLRRWIICNTNNQTPWFFVQSIGTWWNSISLCNKFQIVSCKSSTEQSELAKFSRQDLPKTQDKEFMIIWYLSESSHKLPNTNGNAASPRPLIRSDPRGDQIVLVENKAEEVTRSFGFRHLTSSNQTFLSFPGSVIHRNRSLLFSRPKI